jgi:hypothetical protein
MPPGETLRMVGTQLDIRSLPADDKSFLARRMNYQRSRNSNALRASGAAI